MGQLGIGEVANRLVPTRVLGGHVFRQLSAGGGQTCGVTTDHHIWCWGSNDNGGLGDGTFTRRLAPVRVASTLEFQTVTVGQQFGAHTCALTTGRAAWCWGLNGTGELGDGSHTNRTHPVAVVGGRTWREISAGYGHTCGVTQGRVAFCWGSDERGQLGNDSQRKDWPTPRPVAGGLTFNQISAGFQHSCGVTTGARAYCWGAGTLGQIGDGNRLDRYVPRPVAGTREFARASADGVNHTCAETPVNTVFCWGLNANGELGDGTFSSGPAPRRSPQASSSPR